MFKVQTQKCDQCLFSKDRIVSVPRAKAIIKDCTARNTNFVCHKGSIKGGDLEDLCCRGFWDSFKDENRKLVMAQQLGVVEFVDIT